jgi:hypothetical protein
MKRAELIIVSIAIVSIVMRLFSITGGVLLATLSFCILSMFYLLISFLLLNDLKIKDVFRKEAYQVVGWKHVLFSVITGFVLALGTIGILFAFNNWPGASLLLRVGIFLLFITVAISLIKYIIRPSRYYAGILIRSGIPLLVSIVQLLGATWLGIEQ